MLTALASMAALSNVGFIQASASDIIMCISAGDRDEAARVLSTTLVGLTVLIAVVFAAASALIVLSNPQWLFAVKSIPIGDARLIVTFSLASVLVGFYSGALAAPVSAVAGGGVAQAVITVAKLGELLAVIVLVVLHFGPVAVSAVPLVSATLYAIAYVLLARHFVPWLRISFSRFERATFRRLLHPSLGQFLLYASFNIVAIQLPRIVLGRIGGAAAVTLYSIAVTYTRSAKLVTSSLAQSFQIELTRAYGERRFPLAARLVEAICQVGLWLTGIVLAGLLLFAGPLFHLWTRGKVEADTVLVALLGLGAAASAYNEGFTYLLDWHQSGLAHCHDHLATTIMALVCGVVLYPAFRLHGFAAALVVPELAVAVIGIADVAKALDIGQFQFALRSRTSHAFRSRGGRTGRRDRAKTIPVMTGRA